MGCKHKYKKTSITDPSLVNDMNKSIKGLTTKCVAVKKRGCKK